MKYKFIYKTRQWWIIIGDSCHFYYHPQTKQSVWQAPADLSADDLNFDDLAVLFAKTRGLKIDYQEKDIHEHADLTYSGDSRNNKDSKELLSSMNTAQDPLEDELEEKESDDDEQKESPDEGDDEGQKESIEKGGDQSSDHKLLTLPNGLNLGYLSSEEETEPSDEEEEYDNEKKREEENEEEENEEEENEEEENEEEENEEEENEEVDDLINEIMNNDADDGDNDESDNDESEHDESEHDENEDTEQFKSLLDQYRSQINTYNPYSLVEEDLINELIKHPVFYRISKQSRESIYNNWATETQASKPSTYPTEKQRFYQKLFALKSEIKLKYYTDFKSVLQPFNIPDKQKLFLSFKNMLLLQTEFEKHNRSKYPKATNLKKLKLSKFLETHHVKIPKDIETCLEGEDEFGKWIDLCNRADLPKEIAEHELNWVVGDAKRLECYLHQ